MSNLDPIIDFDFGPEAIAPSGSGRPELSLGAYRYKIVSMTRGETFKQKKPCIDVRFQVVGVGKGGDASEVGLTLTRQILYPEGTDFSETTNAGKGNRARVAEYKALLISLGSDPKQVTETKGRIRTDARDYTGKEGVLYNEPALTQKDYPKVHWIDRERAEAFMDGTDRPRPRVTTTTNVDVNNTTGFNLPGNAPATGIPGLPAMSPMGATPGLSPAPETNNAFGVFQS